MDVCLIYITHISSGFAILHKTSGNKTKAIFPSLVLPTEHFKQVFQPLPHSKIETNSGGGRAVVELACVQDKLLPDEFAAQRSIVKREVTSFKPGEQLSSALRIANDSSL